MPFWTLFYHLVWTTAKREPLLQGDVRYATHDAIRNVAARHNYIVHAVGGVEDHVHVVASIPPSVSVSTAVGRLKGGSSRIVNAREDLGMDAKLQWQSEFSATTFGRTDLDAVRRYVDHQPQRHARNRLNPTLEPR